MSDIGDHMGGWLPACDCLKLRGIYTRISSQILDNFLKQWHTIVESWGKISESFKNQEDCHAERYPTKRVS